MTRGKLAFATVSVALVLVRGPFEARGFPAVNYSAGQTRSNNAVLHLSANGELATFVGAAAGTVHLTLDAQPTVAFVSAASSGGEATTPANLAVGLSASASTTVTVQYAVVGGSATGGGVDYTLASGTVTFDPGETVQQIPLAVVEDCAGEPDETVVVQLSAAVGATLGATTMRTYTILDNDQPVDLASLVASSSDDGTPLSACLVAGSAGRVLVWTDLRDTSGDPVIGASVQIGGSAATASAAQPGVYWREMTAAALPGTSLVALAATTCAGTVMLSSSVAITHVVANATSGGTGGCSPADGNLRVRVLAAETGAPVAGASVLFGLGEGTPFEHNPDALFGGSSTPASNVALTDGSGYASFYDYGSALAGPVTATAGEGTRAYLTVADGNASDLVLPLPLLHPAAIPTTAYGNTAGSTSTWPPTGCADIDLGILLPKLPLDFFSSFRPDSMFARNRCWTTNNGFVGTVALPENIFMPSQSIGPFCLGGSLDQAPWSLDLKDTAATGTSENIEMVLGSAPFADVQARLSGGVFAGLLEILTYRRIGFILDETVPTAPSGTRSVTMNETYPNNFTVTYAGTPPETDVYGLTGADYSGANGTGPLMLLASAVHAWNVAGSSVTIANSDLNAAGMPPGVRRLASVAALYLDPAAHPAVPANRLGAITTVLVRDNGAGSAPFGAAGGMATVTDFLGLAGTTVTSPGTFTWENATANGNSPLYSMHELTVRERRHLPMLSCATTNDVREDFSVQWLVAKPFAATCAGQECFTLPTLPPSFPRATAGVQQRSGFEQRTGSGATCALPSDCIAGEACVDPDAGGPAGMMCMGGAGTGADPYFVEDYVWKLHLYDLELAPSFDFNSFEFSQRVPWLSHESSNTQVFSMPSLAINDVSLPEGHSGTTTATFMVTLTPASGVQATVNYFTTNGTAALGSDYVAASGTLTFAPGETSKSIDVTVNGDTQLEPDETFNVSLSGESGATVSDSQGVATINNDDSMPSLTINDVALAEGNAGIAIASFTVSLSPASGVQATVNFTTADAAATSGSDYVFTSGTLTFAPGETSKPIDVTVNGDSLYEPQETFHVSLSGPSMASVGDGLGVGTIDNDDTPVGPSRVFASVAGADTNDCSNIATPCRTLGGAIMQVAADGEVIVTKSGSYAGGTITKSVKINAASGVVAFSGQPVTVNSGGGTTVVLRGLTLKAVTPGTGTGLLIQSAGAVFVENCVIDGWDVGIRQQGAAEAFVKDSTIRNTNTGLYATTGKTALDTTRLTNNGTGIASEVGEVAVRGSTLSGSTTAGIYADSSSSVTVDKCQVTNNGAGITLPMSSLATVRLSRSVVSGNGIGLQNVGGTLEVNGTNVILGNTTNTTGTITTVALQ